MGKLQTLEHQADRELYACRSDRNAAVGRKYSLQNCGRHLVRIFTRNIQVQLY